MLRADTMRINSRGREERLHQTKKPPGTNHVSRGLNFIDLGLNLHTDWALSTHLSDLFFFREGDLGTALVRARIFLCCGGETWA